MIDKSYEAMYEEFGKNKANIYLEAKFTPDHAFGFNNYIREKDLIKVILEYESNKILDVGCASGRQVFKLAKKSARQVYGVDISQSFIDQANAVKEEKKLTNVVFKKAIAEKLPFEKEYFDLVLCAEVLEHVIDEALVLKEIIRVTKPGGFIIISVPNIDANGTMWRRVKSRFFKKKFTPLQEFSLDAIKHHGNAHLRQYDVDRINIMAQDNKLDLLKITGTGYLDFPFYTKIMNRICKISYLIKISQRIDSILSNTLPITFSRDLIAVYRKN